MVEVDLSAWDVRNLTSEIQQQKIAKISHSFFRKTDSGPFEGAVATGD